MARLALALHKSLAEVRKLSARELAIWRVVDVMHPIGARRGDLRTALLAAAIRRGLGAHSTKLEAFLLDGDPPSVLRKKAAKRRGRSVGQDLADRLGLKVLPHGQ